jgi:hypothetical protein
MATVAAAERAPEPGAALAAAVVLTGRHIRSAARAARGRARTAAAVSSPAPSPWRSRGAAAPRTTAHALPAPAAARLRRARVRCSTHDAAGREVPVCLRAGAARAPRGGADRRAVPLGAIGLSRTRRRASSRRTRSAMTMTTAWASRCVALAPLGESSLALASRHGRLLGPRRACLRVVRLMRSLRCAGASPTCAILPCLPRLCSLAVCAARGR